MDFHFHGISVPVVNCPLLDLEVFSSFIKCLAAEVLRTGFVCDNNVSFPGAGSF